MIRGQITLAVIVSLLLWSCNEAKEKENKDDKQVANDVKKDSTNVVRPSKILFVVTSHSELGNTGDSTGFFLSEAAHPWHVLKNEYEIDFVSPEGGKAPVDGFDLQDSINAEFWNNQTIQNKIQNTKRPEEINANEYIAVHFVGGHGTMWDFPDNPELADIAADVYENGGIVSAVCHGPAGLLNVRLSNTQYLLEGKEITGFTNEEEEAVELSEVVPFSLENQIENRQARFSKTDKFTKNVVVDQRVITGQNPQSAYGVGQAVKKELSQIKMAK